MTGKSTSQPLEPRGFIHNGGFVFFPVREIPILMESKISKAFRYDSETGNIYWKIARGIHHSSGALAGCLDAHGYVIVRLNGKGYKAHRLAWLLYYGKWPLGLLDHINGIKSDNRILNLREASSQQNAQNRKVCNDSTTGIKGLYRNPKSNGWRACVARGGRVFEKKSKSKELLIEWLKAKRIELHQEFAKH